MGTVFINQIRTHLRAKVLMCSFKTLCHLTGAVKPGLGQWERAEFYYLVESQIC